ncbi:MAG: hypothetical protein FWF02_07360 [Micrococcales bacterium]|nr:hypothetical protein [Micrococcales bacterium]MCL2667509.1 hypothetical protein [Micrococcales bacterium]
MNLSELFYEVVKPSGLRREWAPWVFVDAWIEFVDEVVSGYSWGLYEYENERNVRDALSPSLTDSRLLSFEVWREMVDSVIAADERLRAFISDGPVVEPGKVWWRERLPPLACQEFAEDADRLYGVQLQIL